MSDTSNGVHVYKIILIGNPGVGKTVAAKSFAAGKPNTTSQYKATIGVDYALREIQIGRSTCSVQLWDIAGEQRFGTMTKTYFRGAHAVIIMFDLTNEASWEDVDIWRQDVIVKLDIDPLRCNIPILVVGNKLDLLSPERPPVITDWQLQQYVDQHQLWKGIKLSARTDTSFGEVLAELTAVIHGTTPTKLTTEKEQKKREGTLKVIPRATTSEQIKTKQKNAGSSPSLLAHSHDDGVVYTMESSNKTEEKSGCCNIS